MQDRIMENTPGNGRLIWLMHVLPFFRQVENDLGIIDGS
jgi:hypothetical protein